MAAPLSLRLVDPAPDEDPIVGPSTVELPAEAPNRSFSKDGALRVVNDDGTVTIDINPDLSVAADEDDEDDFYRNLAKEIDPGELSRIAGDLLTSIQYDEDSRKDWLDMRARGIKLLGLKLEEPRGDMGASSAPVEGMSTIRHPLLLEATIRFQATARGELLPATGPVKVRNDSVPRPDSQQKPMTSVPATAGQQVEGDALDELGDALEKDMNHYLTVTATEYVPDTDRMLFYIGFGGDGYKKVYNCPLRRRPVSESVDAADIIVSNAATDIRTCGRVTHKIKMRPATLRRMQIVGAYRDVSLVKPQMSDQPTTVEQATSQISGIRPQPVRPEDADYTVYECYCELDIGKFAPKQFKDKELPLPYVVTLEKDSRQILAIRRNWEEDDEQALAKQFFVQFPFIRGLGFYGLGLVHILGNTTTTLTAVWREFIDAGMFANFPGFIYSKAAGRQLSNQIRIPPGGGMGIDLPPGMSVQNAIMPVPYKEPGPAFTAFITHVEEVGQRLGQTADIQVGEGKQETPVGTTMALIEQATKLLDSVHKRLHAAQAEEFGLLKERFREDPEAFWRHNKKASKPWTVEQFKQALQQRELVPVADPNNPTSLHRIAKMMALLQLVQAHGQFFNVAMVLKRIFRVVGIDPEGLFNAQPTPPPPDPRMEAIQQKAQAQAAIAEIQKFQAVLKSQQMQMDAQGKAEDRQSREAIEHMKVELERMRVQQEMIIHGHDMQRVERESQAKLEADKIKSAHEIGVKHVEHQQSLEMDQQQHAQSLQADQEKAQMQGEVERIKAHHSAQAEREKHEHKLETERAANEHKLQAEREKHAQTLQHTEEKHKADLEHKKALAKIAASDATKQGQQAEHKQKLKQSEEAHQQKLKQSREQHETKQAMARTAARNKPKKSGGK